MPGVEFCAGVALVHGDPPKALMIRVRSSGYELPKGHLEQDETPQQAALRELREETGLLSAVTIGEHLGSLEYSFEKEAGTLHKQVQYFLCRAVDSLEFGKRPPGTKGLRWVGASELTDLSLVSENLRPVMRKALDAIERGFQG